MTAMASLGQSHVAIFANAGYRVDRVSRAAQYGTASVQMNSPGARKSDRTCSTENLVRVSVDVL